MTVLEKYWSVQKASRGKLLEALRTGDKELLTRVGRECLDPHAPPEWCAWELYRFAKECDGLRQKYRGLFLTIKQGLTAPPVNPEPEVVLGLLLNGPTVKQQASTTLQRMMQRAAKR